MSSNNDVQQGAVSDFNHMGPRVGEGFPDVVLPDQQGRPVDLHKTLGERKGLVIFYRSASW